MCSKWITVCKFLTQNMKYGGFLKMLPPLIWRVLVHKTHKLSNGNLVMHFEFQSFHLWLEKKVNFMFLVGLCSSSPFTCWSPEAPLPQTVTTFIDIIFLFFIFFTYLRERECTRQRAPERESTSRGGGGRGRGNSRLSTEPLGLCPEPNADA